MRKLALFLSAFALFISAKAQTTISGFVFDESNTPLPEARIFIPELGKGTLTDQSGKYILSDLPQGEWALECAHLGYQTEVVRRTINSPIELNFKLITATLETEEVVVTGGYIGAQHETAVKIDIFKTADLRTSGTPNIMEAIAQVPGVDMIGRGTGISKPVIRGLSRSDVLILNNGFRLENYQFGENHPMGIDGEDAERVEIVKGPASLLYGSDAIGGVLNFIKEKPASAGTFQGNYRTSVHSNTRGISQSIGVKGAGNEAFGSVRLGQKSHMDYLQGGGQFVPNSRFREQTLNASAGSRQSLGTFGVYYDYFAQQLGMTVDPVLPMITERGRAPELWYQDLSSHMLSTKNTLYLRQVKWDINASFQSALRKLQTSLPEPVTEMQLNTLTFESKAQWRLSDQTEFIAGAQAMNQNNTNLNNRPEPFIADAHIQNLGGFLLTQHRFSDAVKLQGGLRLDYYHTQTDAFGEPNTENFVAPINNLYLSTNGSLGATYKLSPSFIFRTNVAKGYRVPNLAELTSKGLHANRFEIGNPNLTPQNSYEADISAHYHDEFLSLDGALFYNYIRDYIHMELTGDTTATGIPIAQYAQETAQLYGGEWGAHLHPKKWPFLHLDANFSHVTGLIHGGEHLHFIPQNKLKFKMRVERKSWKGFNHLSAFVTSTYAMAQNHPSDHETPTPAYFITGAGVTFDYPIGGTNWSWALVGQNLFDVAYADHLSNLRPMGYNNTGRNISLNLKIPFGKE